MDTPSFDKKVWKQNMGFVIITAKCISKNMANIRGLWKLCKASQKSQLKLFLKISFLNKKSIVFTITITLHNFKYPNPQPPPKKKKYLCVFNIFIYESHF